MRASSRSTFHDEAEIEGTNVAVERDQKRREKRVRLAGISHIAEIQ